jgi:hypothetical protein
MPIPFHAPNQPMTPSGEIAHPCQHTAASSILIPMPTPTNPKPKSKPKPPHPFVLEALAPLHPEVRRMFSGFAVYSNNLLLMMLREHTKIPQDNGIWLVLSEGTDPADASLRQDLPSLRPIQTVRGKISHWLLIPSDSADFEHAALRACDLILAHDPRLGRIPQSRR